MASTRKTPAWQKTAVGGIILSGIIGGYISSHDPETIRNQRRYEQEAAQRDAAREAVADEEASATTAKEQAEKAERHRSGQDCVGWSDTIPALVTIVKANLRDPGSFVARRLG